MIEGKSVDFFRYGTKSFLSIDGLIYKGVTFGASITDYLIDGNTGYPMEKPNTTAIKTLADNPDEPDPDPSEPEPGGPDIPDLPDPDVTPDNTRLGKLNFAIRSSQKDALQGLLLRLEIGGQVRDRPLDVGNETSFGYAGSVTFKGDNKPDATEDSWKCRVYFLDNA